MNKIFWQAFEDLSDRRLRLEDNPQAIQGSEILAYAKIYGIIDQDDIRDLYDYIGILDKIWLNNAAKVRDQEARKRASRQGRKR